MAVSPPFATTSDLEDRGIDLGGVSEAVVDNLLDDASQILLDEMPGAVARASAKTLTRVVCAMVARALDDPAESAFPFGGPGFESAQVSIGPFQHSARRFNPSDRLYLSKSERRQLRGGQRAFMVSTVGDPLHVDDESSSS